MTRARDDIEKAVAAFLRLISGDDPAMILREAEVNKGHVIVPVGSVPWLPLKEWGERDVVSLDGDEVRIVAIGAHWPGGGALRRLLAGIEAAGLRPVIICPLGTMESILRRWGWQHVEIGDSFDTREDQWRPTAAHTGATGETRPVTPAEAAARDVGADSRPSVEILGEGDG